MTEEGDLVDFSFLGDPPRGCAAGPGLGKHFDGSPKKGLSHVHASHLSPWRGVHASDYLLTSCQSSTKRTDMTGNFDSLFRKFTNQA